MIYKQSILLTYFFSQLIRFASLPGRAGKSRVFYSPKIFLFHKAYVHDKLGISHPAKFAWFILKSLLQTPHSLIFAIYFLRRLKARKNLWKTRKKTWNFRQKPTKAAAKIAKADYQKTGILPQPSNFIFFFTFSIHFYSRTFTSIHSVSCPSHFLFVFLSFFIYRIFLPFTSRYSFFDHLSPISFSHLFLSPHYRQNEVFTRNRQFWHSFLIHLFLNHPDLFLFLAIVP